MSFVHLHCHSEYSLLDGANRIDDLIARARELEQPALAITDHGNLHAAWEFQEKAKKAKIKPIIGMEAYVAPGDRRLKARGAPGQKPYYHLVILARDIVGYGNLVKLSSLGFTEGFYTRPRVDRELLAKYSEGLIVSSACMAGEVATHLLQNNDAAAREAAAWYAETFKNRFYLEVQAHDSEGQSRLNERIFALAADVGLPVVATNDAHFLKATDHDAHDILLCIGLGKDRDDKDRMRYVTLALGSLPIGSGVTEASAKTVIGKRANGSGQRWGTPGLRGVLTLRAIHQSDRLPRFWDRFSRPYTAVIQEAA